MPIINKTKRTAAIYNRGREVVKVYDHGTLAWQKQSSIPDYLCFTALEAGQFTLTIPAAVTATYLSYVEWSKDGRTWTHTDNTSEAVTIDVQVASGEKVYWRGSGIQYMVNDTRSNNYFNQASYFSSTGRFDVSGNIMSMLYADDFEGKTAFPGTSNQYYNIGAMFQHCTNLIHANDLLLPAMILKHLCYTGMFEYCSSLVDAPALPATSFGGANYCYMYMYRYCTSLVEPSDLSHVTDTGRSSLQEMYRGCTSLTKTTFPQAATYGRYCCYGMYLGCTSITSADMSYARTFNSNSCGQLFYGCTNLKYVKCLATDISETGCLTNWLYNVSSTGTFIQASGVEWPRGASGIPTGWVDVEKRTMPSGYKQLLQVTSNGTAYIQLSFGFEETDEVAATFSVDTSQTTDKYIVCPQTWNNNSNRYGMGVHNYGQYTAAFGNLSTGNTILTPRTYNNGELHNWTYAAATFAVTDKSCSINITGYTFGGITTNLRLFYGYNSNTKGAISSYKHIKGSTTACDFVAAIRESDDTAGLYDLANDEFVTCNGLTAGEEI